MEGNWVIEIDGQISRVEVAGDICLRRPSPSGALDPIIIIIIIIRMDVSCHRPFLPGTSLEPAVIPTAQASSFTLQYFPYYVCCSKCNCLL